MKTVLHPFFKKKRKWIEKHLPKSLILQKEHNKQTLPETLVLAAIDACYRIIYIEQQSPLRLIERPGHELVFWGDVSMKKKVVSKLKNWLYVTAERVFNIECQQLSAKMDLQYNKISIRGQKTLWGSCTKEKTINLNYKILFLPYHLMRSILIHELCHTTHMNHGIRFWKLVGRYDDNYKEHNQQLRHINLALPWWTD